MENSRNKFQNIKQDIYKDILNGLSIEILEETDNTITVYDSEDIFEREYTLVNPDVIDIDWMMNRLTATPSVKEYPEIDYESLFDFILKHMDKRMLMTLQGIVFCNDVETDWDYLHDIPEFRNEIECSNLPDNNTVGIMWYEACKVFVNVGSIIQYTNQMLESGDIYDWEYQDCINSGILTTLVHELRHLAQANPYLPADIELLENDELDAEEYARNFEEKYGFINIINVSFCR